MKSPIERKAHDRVGRAGYGVGPVVRTSGSLTEGHAPVKLPLVPNSDACWYHIWCVGFRWVSDFPWAAATGVWIDSIRGSA